MAKKTPAATTTQPKSQDSKAAAPKATQGGKPVRVSKARAGSSTAEVKQATSDQAQAKAAKSTTKPNGKTTSRAAARVERVPKKLAKSLGIKDQDRDKLPGPLVRAMAGDIPHAMKCTAAGVKKVPAKGSGKGSGKGESGPGILESSDPFHAGEADELVRLSPEDDPDLDVTKLPLRWQLFIDEYLIDYNATKAAMRAGYTESGASDAGYRISNDRRVAKILQARTQDRLEAIRMTRERVLDAFADVAEADRNELSEHRRVCCPYCWGERDEETGAHAKQLTPGQWSRARDAWDERRLREAAMSEGKVDIGDFQTEPGNWYDKRKAINPDCPECFGDGIGEIHLHDTRKLSKRARAIYEGTEEGKDGIKINTIKREVALGVLAKHHKIYDDTPVVNITTVAPEVLDEIYAKGTADAMEKKGELLGRGERVRAAVKNGGG